MSKKNASLDALFDESSSDAVQLQEIKPAADTAPAATLPKRGKGRPKKIAGNRQQLPVYLPEAVYFEIVDWVALRKRSDRQYSMNDVVLEALDVWLAKKGRPSIKELIEKQM